MGGQSTSRLSIRLRRRTLNVSRVRKSHQKRERILAPSRPNSDGALPHPRQCSDANVFFVVKDEAVILMSSLIRVPAHTLGTAIWAYHFIRHDEEIELLRDRGYFLQFSASKNLPHGVVRRVDDNHFGTRSDRSSENIVLM